MPNAKEDSKESMPADKAPMTKAEVDAAAAKAEKAKHDEENRRRLQNEGKDTRTDQEKSRDNAQNYNKQF